MSEKGMLDLHFCGRFKGQFCTSTLIVLVISWANKNINRYNLHFLVPTTSPPPHIFIPIGGGGGDIDILVIWFTFIVIVFTQSHYRSYKIYFSNPTHRGYNSPPMEAEHSELQCCCSCKLPNSKSKTFRFVVKYFCSK